MTQHRTVYQNLSASGLLRINQIVGDPKAIPPIPSIIPVSRSTWWRGVKCGKYPKPIKLGEKTTAWNAEDIHKLLIDLCSNTEGDI
jgi:predicted DNA-binding transcriptional regulator AlpA